MYVQKYIIPWKQRQDNKNKYFIIRATMKQQRNDLVIAKSQ